MTLPSPAILFAANTAVTTLTDKGDTFIGVELLSEGFRLTGARDGKRLVIQVSFTDSTGAVAVRITTQVNQTARSKTASGADHTAAVRAALA